MRGRLSIVAGLVVGVVVAGLLLGWIVTLAPDEPARTTPAPSRGPATPSPSVVASAGPTAVASASAVASEGAFHVSQPAPALVLLRAGGGTIDRASLKGKTVRVHFWIDSDGIIRDGALGGIEPDVLVTGRKTILPGVDVTP